MKSLDRFFTKRYSAAYTCKEFVDDVWLHLTGELPTSDNLKEASEPVSPCVVYMENCPDSEKHVGVFYNGKVIHLSPSGVQYIEIDYFRLAFRKLSFYK